jgi:hypothetical protein
LKTWKVGAGVATVGLLTALAITQPKFVTDFSDSQLLKTKGDRALAKLEGPKPAALELKNIGANGLNKVAASQEMSICLVANPNETPITPAKPKAPETIVMAGGMEDGSAGPLAALLVLAIIISTPFFIAGAIYNKIQGKKSMEQHGANLTRILKNGTEFFEIAKHAPRDYPLMKDQSYGSIIIRYLRDTSHAKNSPESMRAFLALETIYKSEAYGAYLYPNIAHTPEYHLTYMSERYNQKQLLEGFYHYNAMICRNHLIAELAFNKYLELVPNPSGKDLAFIASCTSAKSVALHIAQHFERMGAEIPLWVHLCQSEFIEISSLGFKKIANYEGILYDMVLSYTNTARRAADLLNLFMLVKAAEACANHLGASSKVSIILQSAESRFGEVPQVGKIRTVLRDLLAT